MYKPVLLCITAMVFAFACGGKSTNNGILEVNIRGKVDFSANPSKPLNKADNYTAIAYNINNPSQTWNVTIVGDSYSTTVVRKTDVKIDFKSGNQVAISRILTAEDTLTNLNSKVNSVTHAQANMTLHTLKQSNGDTLKNSLEKVNNILFGKASISESEYVLSAISSEHQTLKATLATYGQFLKSTNAHSFTNIMQLFNQALQNLTPAIVVEHYVNFVNLLDASSAAVIASAHEGAKNIGHVTVPAFDSIVNGFTSEIILAAIDAAKEIPVFGADADTLRTASPGVLFKYSFPLATTKDILGIESYIGSWKTTPAGAFRTDIDAGRTIHWIPSEKDIGTDFEFNLRVKGINGKFALSTKTITISTKSLEIKGLQRKQLPNQPIAGPIINNQYFYLVSKVSSTSQYQLEKYLLSDIDANGADTLLGRHNWVLPTGFSNILDIYAYKNIIYLSAGSQGIRAFDANWLGELTSDPTYSATSISSTKISAFGEQLYSFSTVNTPIIQRGSLSLNNFVDLTEQSQFIQTSSDPAFAVIDQSYLYLSQQNTARIYTLSTTGALGLSNGFTPVGTNLKGSEAILGTPLYQADSNRVQEVKLQPSLTTSSFTPAITNLNSKSELITNGTYAYLSYSNSSSVAATSMTHSQTTVTATAESVDYPLYTNNKAERITMMIRNIPEGIDSGKSGAYLYTIGQALSNQISATWFIKSFKLQPKSD